MERLKGRRLAIGRRLFRGLFESLNAVLALHPLSSLKQIMLRT